MSVLLICKYIVCYAFVVAFGAPFLPLHPTKYAEMLGSRMEKHNVKVWLINTGWSGGEYGTGDRIKLRFTRAMITAALEGKLDNVSFELTKGTHICHRIQGDITI